MRRDLLDVEELQPVRCEHALDRKEREVREVLVVDRVELRLLDQPQQVRELHREDAVRREQCLQAGDEARAGRARAPARCCRSSRSRLVPLRAQPSAPLSAEELDHRRHARSPRPRAATLAAGSIPSTGTPRFDEVLEQIAVVACDLDHLGVRAEAETVADLLDVAPSVLHPARPSSRRSTRSRRRSPPAPRPRAAARAGTRRRPTRAADRSARPGELILAQVRVREWRDAEIDEDARERRAADPAGERPPATGADAVNVLVVLHSSLSVSPSPARSASSTRSRMRFDVLNSGSSKRICSRPGSQLAHGRRQADPRLVRRREAPERARSRRDTTASRAARPRRSRAPCRESPRPPPRPAAGSGSSRCPSRH